MTNKHRAGFVLKLLALLCVPFAHSSEAANSGAYAGGGVAAPASSEGMIFMQLQQMQGEMAQLRGMVEEQQEQIRRLQREALERYQDLDQRLSSVQAAASAPSSSANNLGGVSAAPSSNTPAVLPNAGASSSQTPAADPDKERVYYDAAFDLVKAKEFDKASQAFNAFLRKYPASQYAANAQYWLGEVCLAKSDFKGASQAFSLVAQNYPKHPKVPDALYKLADAEQRMGNVEKAQGILRQLTGQYPDSSAAQLAKRQLKP